MNSRLMVKCSLVAVSMVFAGLAGIQPAVAAEDDSDGNLTGADIAPPGFEVPDSVEQQSDLKMKLAEAYMNFKSGEVSDSQLRGAMDAYQQSFSEKAKVKTSDFPAVLAALQGGRAGLDTFLAESSPAGTAARGPSYSGKILPMTHFGQNKNYYCGPATGKMILKFFQKDVSAFDGTGLTQGHVGNANHMRTDINGKTAYASGLLRIGLNRWRVGSNTGLYTDVSQPSPQKFRQGLGLDIDNDIPMAAGTVEFSNGNHYNNHPVSSTIGHWIVVHGYVNSGNDTRFLDPATTVWSGVSPNFYYSTNSFVNRFLQNNGITW